jgi:hypothetical protein
MFSLIESRPHVGLLLSTAAPVSAILTFLQIITPLLGAAGAIFGAAAGFLTLLIKWREYKEKSKK